MLEGMLGGVLDKVLGKYVKGIDRQQLKVAAWSGNIKLHDLELNEAALEALNLPVIIQRGYIGTLHMEIPWARLKSEPVIIRLDRVFLVAGPKDPHAPWSEKEEEVEQEGKMSKLETWEAGVEKKLQAKMKGKDTDDASSKGFTGKLVEKIVDNLQFKVTKMHLRYEDSLSRPEHPFSAGLTIDKLEAYTADENWVQKFVANPLGALNKYLELRHMALYWNTDSETVLNEPLNSRWLMHFEDKISTSEGGQAGFMYMLRPVSATLKVVMNKDEAPWNLSPPKPKLDLVFSFSQVALALQEDQYCGVLRLLEFISNFNKWARFRKFRPTVPPGQDPRAWFMYAANAALEVVREKNKKSSWTYLIERRRDRLNYLKAYKQTRKVPWINANQQEIEASEEILDNLHRKLAYDDIIYFRSICVQQLEREAMKYHEKRSNESWTTWITGWGRDKSSRDVLSSSLSKEDVEKLDEIVGYTGEEEAVVFPSGYVNMVINLTMQRASVSLVASGACEELVEMAIEGLRSNVKLRKGDDGMDVVSSISSMEVIDRFTEDTCYPRVGYSDVSVGDFVEVRFSKNPGESEEDMKLSLKMTPITAIGNKILLDRVMIFFQDTEPVDLTGLESIAKSGLKDLRSMTETQLEDAIAKHKTLDVDIDIRAPTFIFPASYTILESALLVLDLGKLRIKSDMRKDVRVDETTDGAPYGTPKSLAGSSALSDFASVRSPQRPSSINLASDDDDEFVDANDDEFLDAEENFERSSVVSGHTGGGNRAPSSIGDDEFFDVDDQSLPPPTPSIEKAQPSFSKSFLVESDQKDEEELYDRFDVQLTAFQLLITKENEDWSKVLSAAPVEKGEGPHIIEPVNLSIHVEKCIFNRHLTYPAIKADATLDDMSVNISDGKVSAIVDVVNGFMEVPETKPWARSDFAGPIRIQRYGQRNWKLRYAVITKSDLFILESLEDTEPESHTILAGAVVKSGMSVTNKPQSIEVEQSDKTLCDGTGAGHFFLLAGSQPEMERIQAMLALRSRRVLPSDAKSPGKLSTLPEDEEANDSGVLSPRHSRMQSKQSVSHSHSRSRSQSQMDNFSSFGSGNFSKELAASLDSKKSKPEVSKENFLEFRGNFVIHRLALVLSRTNASKAEGVDKSTGNIALFSIEGLGVKIMKQSFCLVADGGLDKITMEDMLQHKASQYRYLAFSGESPTSKSSLRKLIEVQFRRYDPSFEDYQSTRADQCIDVKFDRFNVYINRDTLALILDLGLDLQLRSGDIKALSKNAEESSESPPYSHHEAKDSMASTAKDSLFASVSSVASTNATVERAAKLFRRKKPTKKRAALYVKAEMSTVLLGLNAVRREQRLASISFRELYVEVDQFKDTETMKVIAKLGDLSVDDHWNEGSTLYTRVFGSNLKDSAALAFSMETFAPGMNNPGYDIGFNVTMGSIRFVYFKDFISLIQNYATEGPVMNALKAAKEAASKRAKEATESLKNTEKVAHYSVHIGRPMLMVPRSLSAYDGLVLDLGETTVMQKLDHERDESAEKHRVERINVSVKDMSIYSLWHDKKGQMSADDCSMVLLSGKSSARSLEDARKIVEQNAVDRNNFSASSVLKQYIVEDVHVNVNMTRPILKSVVTLPKLHVDVYVTKVQFSIAENQIRIIARVMKDNAQSKGAVDALDVSLEEIDLDRTMETAAAGIQSLDENVSKIDSYLFESAGEAISLQAHVSLEEFCVEVLRGDGVVPHSETKGKMVKDGVVEFSLDNVQVAYLARGSRYTKAELELSKIHLRDTRLDTKSVHRDLLAPSEGHMQVQSRIAAGPNGDTRGVESSVAQDEVQLLVRFVENDGFKSIDVVIEKPRFVIVHEPLFALRDFATNAGGIWESVMKEDENSDEEENVGDGTSQPMTPGRSGTLILDSVDEAPDDIVPASPKAQIESEDAKKALRMSVKFTVQQPQVFILKNPYIHRSKALVLQGSFCGQYDKDDVVYTENANLMFLDFQLVWCTFDKENQTAISIMDPVSMRVGYESKRRDDNLSRLLRTVNVSVADLRVKLSYEDFKNCLGIWKEFNERGNAAAPPTTEVEKVPEKKKEKEKEGRELTLEEKVIKKQLKRQRQAQHNGPPKPPVNNVPNVNMDMIKFQVWLINDCGGQNVPLIHIDTSDVSVVLTARKKTLRCTLDFTMSLKYFNLLMAGWEPLLEPWSPTITYFQKMKKGQTQKKVTVDSKSKIDINMSHTCVDTIVQTQRLWTEDFYHEESDGKRDSISEAFHQYLLQNNLGQDVEYWTYDNPEKQIIKADETIPLTMKNESLLSTGSRMVCFSPCGQWERSVHEVNINRVDISRFRVFKVEGRDSVESGKVLNFATLVCQVSLVNGAKKLRLSSSMEVVNDTKIPLVLRHEVNRKNNVILKQGERFSLPLGYNGDVLFRPLADGPTAMANSSGEDTHDILFCEEPIGVDYILGPGKDQKGRLVKCCRKDDEHRSWVCNAYVTCKEELHSLVLTPPMIIRNALTTPITFRIAEFNHETNEERLLLSGVLECDKTIPVYNVPAVKSIKALMYIQVPGRWRQKSPLVLMTHNKMHLSDHLELLDDQNQILRLSVDRSGGEGRGDAICTLYCPYWIINKSGLPLLYRQESTLKNHGVSAGQVDNEHFAHKDREDPHMFSFASGGVAFKEKLLVKVAKCRWSKPFSIDNLGVAGTVTTEDMSGSRIHDLGVSIEMGSGDFIRTKVVTFSPRYVVVNNMDKQVLVRQSSVDSPDKAVKIAGGGTTQKWYWPVKEEKPRLSFCYDDGGQWHWSGGFDIDNVGSFSIKLRNRDGTVVLTQVEVILENATVFILLVGEAPFWDYRIENKSSIPLRFGQKNIANWQWQDLDAGHSSPYAWDELVDADFSLCVDVQGVVEDIVPDEVPFEKQVRVRHPDGDNITLQISVKLDGPVKVIKIEEMIRGDEKRSVGRLSKAFSSQIGEGPSAGGDDAEEEDEVLGGDKNAKFQPGMTVVVNMDYFGVSLIDDAPMEILYISVRDGYVQYVKAEHEERYEVKIGNIQIDNQYPASPHPIMLAYAAKNKNHQNPMLHVSIVKNNSHKGVDYYKYASILLQELDIMVNDQIVSVLTNVAASLKPSIDEYESLDELFGRLQGALEVPKASGGDKLYFEVLHLHPVKVNVTYQSMGAVGSTSTPAMKRNPIKTIIGALGVTITNVDDAPLRLNALLIENALDTKTTLIDRVKKHYTRQAITELYKIVGSIDLIGNPVGLVSNVGTGFHDFFYEPAQGLVVGPEEFVEGVGKGASSLVKNTAYGLFNSASKITGSIGTGVAQLSLDEEYIRSRQLQLYTGKTNHASEGIASGFEALGSGISQGFCGMFTAPVRGAEAEGAKGFIKGIGKGAVGVVVKPIAGGFDAVSRAAAGIRNTAVMNDARERKVRLPRYIGTNKVIEAYSPAQAEGQQLLRDLLKGKHEDELYITHSHIDHDKATMSVLLSDRHIFLFGDKCCKMEWSVKYIDVDDMRLSEDGIYIVTTLCKSGTAQLLHIEAHPRKQKPIYDRMREQWVLVKFTEERFPHAQGRLMRLPDSDTSCYGVVFKNLASKPLKVVSLLRMHQQWKIVGAATLGATSNKQGFDFTGGDWYLWMSFEHSMLCKVQVKRESLSRMTKKNGVIYGSKGLKMSSLDSTPSTNGPPATIP